MLHLLNILHTFLLQQRTFFGVMKDVLKDIKISQIEMILNNLLFKDISDMSEKK